MKLFNTQPREVMEAAFAQAGVRMMRVEEMTDDDEIAKCRLYFPAGDDNPEIIGETDYLVRVFSAKSEGDKIYVLAPELGTDKRDEDGDVIPFVEVAGTASVSAIAFKITGTLTGGGNYKGRSIGGSAESLGTGGEEMPMGMDVAATDDVVALNLAENGNATGTNFLPVSGDRVYHFGLVVGTATDGQKIVVFEATLPLPAPGSNYQVVTANAGVWVSDWVRAH